MEKKVPNKHSRRHSTGNFYLEPSSYDSVLSRYLSGPFPSCHDHCKPSGFDFPPEPRSTGSIKRPSKPNVDSGYGLKKQFTHIPKSPTEHVKIANVSVPKQHAKLQPVEFKARRQDLKSKSTIKSKNGENDPFYIPDSRITRRYSDIVLPVNDFGLGDGFEASDFGVLTRNRSIKRNDSKPVKTSTTKKIENGKILKQTRNDSTRSEVDHSLKKSNPGNVAEGVHEKNKNSDFHVSSKNEERLSENGQNPGFSSSEATKTEKPTRVGKVEKKNEENVSQKLKFKQGKITEKQCDNTGLRKHKFRHGNVLDVNQNGQEDGKSLRRMSCDGEVHSNERNSENVVLKSCETEENKRHLQGNNVIEETASKLIKTRKSKVQALVGAFEMISTSGF